jgi:hypothetical protein
MYVTLTCLGGFVARLDAPAERSDRKVYCLTPADQERVTEWMSDVSWPRPDLSEFHMKLIAAAQSALSDPISIIDAQRRDPLRRPREVGASGDGRAQGLRRGPAARRYRAPPAGRPELVAVLRDCLDEKGDTAVNASSRARAP